MRGAAAWAALAVLAAACGGGSGSDGADGAARSAGQFAVGTRFETLVDETRGTEGREGVDPKPTRTFETVVYYPATGESGGDPRPGAPAAATGGGFPLVVFSHGSGVSSPVRYDLLFRYWAAAGYVVVAPKYPISSTSLPDNSADVVSQPADISFLISEFLRRSPGLVDASRIAAAGHSLGGVMTMGAVFNRCCLDPRIRAGIVLAGGKSAFPDDGWFAGIRTPLLVVHGDDDRIVRIAAGQEVFTSAPAPKAMLTVFGGDHNRPYGGALTTTENAERLGATAGGPTAIVNQTVVAFLDRYVKDRPRALTDLAERLLDEVSVKLEVVE